MVTRERYRSCLTQCVVGLSHSVSGSEAEFGAATRSLAAAIDDGEASAGFPRVSCDSTRRCIYVLQTGMLKPAGRAGVEIE